MAPVLVVVLALPLLLPGSTAANAQVVDDLLRELTGRLQPADEVPPVPDVDAARFTVRVETSSDWTRIRLAPGRVVEERLVGYEDGARVRQLGDGWHLRPGSPAGGAWAEFDVVFAELTDAAQFRIQVDKGFLGETRLTMVNRNAGPETVVDVVNQRRSLLDHNNRRVYQRERDDLLGTVPIGLPRADDRQLVLAFYYPWFREYRDADLRDRPSNPRSTHDADAVLSMTRQSRTNGVDGFIVSWAGEDNDGAGFDLVQRAAEETDGLVAGYLETLRARDAWGRIDTDELYDWLLELLEARVDSPSYLRADGVPVVFVWQMGKVEPSSWQDILDRLAQEGHEVRLLGDTAGNAYREVSWGVHHYLPTGSLEERTRLHQRRQLSSRVPALLDEGTEPRLVAGGVAPGFSKPGHRAVHRGPGGERYEATWDAALAGDPDWITITSWNEWFEETSVEPSENHGDRALRQTRDRSANWRR